MNKKLTKKILKNIKTKIIDVCEKTEGLYLVNSKGAVELSYRAESKVHFDVSIMVPKSDIIVVDITLVTGQYYLPVLKIKDPELDDIVEIDLFLQHLQDIYLDPEGPIQGKNSRAVTADKHLLPNISNFKKITSVVVSNNRSVTDLIVTCEDDVLNITVPDTELSFFKEGATVLINPNGIVPISQKSQTH